MTDEQKAAIEAAIRHFDFHKHVYADHMRALLAAGASEGQAVESIQRANARNSALRERIAGMEKDVVDAARYRWLKSNADIIFNEAQGFVSPITNSMLYTAMPCFDEMDAAVDAAIAKEPK